MIRWIISDPMDLKNLSRDKLIIGLIIMNN